ncbi:hypothetical protein VT52_027295 [Streptomyces malaysiense]|uniref:Transmembrane protein n=2 Tax=Streptomyces malaysiense TaxID=1428626 RepID=A0A1J4PX99_9ACTN|nr:hypothetical protein [Streptomyces malaysiense]OIK24448.1 hypothetical protein VT52_027295 [Streptomyces malaysiense]
MEAGPRDTAPGAERVTTEGERPDQGEGLQEDRREDLREDRREDRREDLGEGPQDDLDDGLVTEAEDRLADDGPDESTDGVTEDGPAPEEMYTSGPEVEVELRPQRRLRIWQLAPIVGLSAVGSLMFAFPLAFDGDSGAVIAMLGLLICCCAAGWGMMAARRVGYTWPGLPPRGSGRRPDWRVVLGYVLLVAVVAVLAVGRVARLR